MKGRKFIIDETVVTKENCEEVLKIIKEQDNHEISDENIKIIEKFTKNVALFGGEKLEEFKTEILRVLSEISKMMNFNKQVRMVFVRCLIRMAWKNAVDPLTAYSTLLPLIIIEDNEMRLSIFTFIINDLKSRNKVSHQSNLNRETVILLRNWIQSRKDNLANFASKILVRFFRKNIISNQLLINTLADCCLHTNHKVQMTGLTFMLNKNRLEKDEKMNSDSDEEFDQNTAVAKRRRAEMAYRVGKKSEARKKHMEKEVKNYQKKVKAAEKRKLENNVTLCCNVNAIGQLYNSQSYVENLFKHYIRKCNSQFLMLSMELISRIVGYDQLELPNFFAYLINKLTIKTIDVTKFLVFVTQAAHENVSPIDIEPVVKKIADEFVNESISGVGITLGLNTIREICVRCPYAISEELLHLLCEYKNYKDKNVSVAARGLINAFREINPALLPKAFLGKPTEGTMENLEIGTIQSLPRSFGDKRNLNYIPGAEILMLEQEEENKEEDDEYEECSMDSDDDNEEWTTIQHSDNEVEVEKNDQEKELDANPKKRQELALEATTTKIFTDADLKKIREYQEKKNITPYSKKRANEWIEESDLTKISKRQKMNKAERMEAVLEGREDREKYGFEIRRMNQHASTTNREKTKKKNYQMVRVKKQRKKINLSSREKINMMRKNIDKQLKFRN